MSKPAAEAKKPAYSPGLVGVPAGETVISTVGKESFGLTYRGDDIRDLAHKCIYEEIAFLLINGHLPTSDELAAYLKKLAAQRRTWPLLTAPADAATAAATAVACAGVCRTDSLPAVWSLALL